VKWDVEPQRRRFAFKTGGKIHLRSRNDNDFSSRYSGVVKGLAKLPDEPA
jgi:ATP-dependent DNA ligase